MLLMVKNSSKMDASVVSERIRKSPSLLFLCFTTSKIKNKMQVKWVAMCHVDFKLISYCSSFSLSPSDIAYIKDIQSLMT